MKIDYKENWYELLKERRKEAGYTQEEIATICHTYKSKWSRYESGQAYPSEIEWQQIYFYLRSSPFDYFNMEESCGKEWRLVEMSYKLTHAFAENKSKTIQSFITETINEIDHLFQKKSDKESDWIL